MRGFTSIMTQRATFQLMKILSLTRERSISSRWQVLYVSLTRLTKTSLLRRKSYSDGTLDSDILGSKISKWLICIGCLKVQKIPRQWPTVNVPNMLPMSFGNGHRQPNKVNTINNNIMKEQEFKKYHLLSGYMISTDNYILRASGRLYRTKGGSDSSNMLSGGCIFIDHVSGYVKIKHQVAINATETVKEKLTFERGA